MAASDWEKSTFAGWNRSQQGRLDFTFWFPYAAMFVRER